MLLETLFQNLIENAIHASSEGQEIEITGDLNEGLLRVSVTDHGRGMRAEDLSRITEPFVQLDAAHSRQHGGVGSDLHFASGYLRFIIPHSIYLRFWVQGQAPNLI